MRILCAITDDPINMSDLSKRLNFDYKIIQHNIKVLEKNNLIVRKGDGYGDMFFPSELISSNLPTLYHVIRKVETKLERSEKNMLINLSYWKGN